MRRDKKRKEGEQEHSHWKQHTKKVKEVEEDDDDFCFSIGDLVSIDDGWNAKFTTNVIQGIIVDRKLMVPQRSMCDKPLDRGLYMVCLMTDGIMRAPDWYSTMDLDLLSSVKESE